MKNKFYMLAAIAIAFFGSANAQVAPVTPDIVALPSTGCPSGGTLFPATGTYAPSSLVQLGVNNTGTDVCQDFVTGRTFQVMAWDDVTNVVSQTSFTSAVYVSWNFNNAPTGSVSFAGGYDPDVAIWSDTFGTFMEIVFENNASGKIDGYTYKWNGSTFVPYATLPFKCTLSVDPTKKCKNPNVTATKDKGRFAVVWHEEGLVTPPQTLTVTYSTTPPVSYTNTVSLLQSRVYINCIDKPGYLGDLLGSPTATILNKGGQEVIRVTPPGTNNLFDRNYNADVSMSEEAIGSGGSFPSQMVISVAFLSQYFDPSTFSIVSDGLSVVQGTMDDFRVNFGTTTTTKNFKRTYNGKPRIASRLTLTGTYVAKDFSVVMGNASPGPGCVPGPVTSKLHFWWNETGSGAIPCPVGGTDIISTTSFSNSGITTTDPVISCVNAKGHYAVAFATNFGSTYDIVANTYRQGSLVTAGAFSYVNYGTCAPSQNGNQAIPSIASFRRPGASQVDNAYSNYLFWDQSSKTLNWKKPTNQNIPGGGTALRQMQDETSAKDDQTKFMAYPNPTDSEISFDFKLDTNEIASEIEIFNMSGQSVDKFAVTEGSKQKRAIDKMPSGTYIAILKTNLQNHRLQFIRK